MTNLERFADAVADDHLVRDLRAEIENANGPLAKVALGDLLDNHLRNLAARHNVEHEGTVHGHE